MVWDHKKYRPKEVTFKLRLEVGIYQIRRGEGSEPAESACNRGLASSSNWIKTHVVCQGLANSAPWASLSSVLYSQWAKNGLYTFKYLKRRRIFHGTWTLYEIEIAVAIRFYRNTFIYGSCMTDFSSHWQIT